MVLLGPPGTGKTHLTIPLGIVRCERGAWSAVRHPDATECNGRARISDCVGTYEASAARARTLRSVARRPHTFLRTKVILLAPGHRPLPGHRA
ncbi:ATP-binding protein [Microbacterium sp. F51-2R]|uniref:ATP-binding protein n=1 Tax=Microbacterium sp. F51-2R TaxID=3445777 RepID=UPI003FA138E7